MRPSEKALMDAAEAEEIAVSAAEFAARALDKVTRTEVQARVEKLETALAKAKEKDTAKALEKMAELALETSEELEQASQDLAACKLSGEATSPEEWEGDATCKWAVLDQRQREGLRVCFAQGAQAAQEVANLAGGARGMAGAAGSNSNEGSGSVKFEGGVAGGVRVKKECASRGGEKEGKKERGKENKGEKKTVDKEARKVEKEVGDMLKSVKSNLEAARKLHKKSSELFGGGVQPPPPSAQAARTKSAKAAAPQGSKVRAQKLSAHAGRLAAIAEELGSCGFVARCGASGGGADDMYEVLEHERKTARVQVERMSGEVAVEAVLAVSCDIETKVRMARGICTLLRTGDRPEGESDGEEAGVGGDGGVAATFLTTAQGRKKAAKQVENLRQLCTQLKADTLALVGCAWAEVPETGALDTRAGEECGDAPAESCAAASLPSLCAAVGRFRVWCRKVDEVLAEANILAAEVDELEAPAAGKAAPAAPAAQRGRRVTESDEDEPAVATARKRRVVDSSDDEQPVAASARMKMVLDSDEDE